MFIYEFMLSLKAATPQSPHHMASSPVLPCATVALATSNEATSAATRGTSAGGIKEA